MKTKYVAIISVFSMVLGFLLGRLSLKEESLVKTKEVVKYEPSERILRDTIEKYRLIPYETFVRDTVIRYLTQSVDTAEILRDYFVSRKYSLDFSSDSLGTFITDVEVYRNSVVSASSVIRPVVKTVYRENVRTVTKIPAIQFYGMIGSSLDFSSNKVSLGVDLRQKYLLGVSGIRYGDKYFYSIDVGLKW